MAGEKLTVVFPDPNGKEIARQAARPTITVRSAAASSRRATGVDGAGRRPSRAGEPVFNVEEYKRPKFQVTLAVPKTAAKLNGKVVLTGQATAYTGAAVDGAQVT